MAETSLSDLAPTSSEIKLKIPGLTCGSCEKKIKNLLAEQFSNLIAKDPEREQLDVLVDLSEKVVTIRLAVDRFDYQQLIDAIESMDPVKFKCTIISAPGLSRAQSPVPKIESASNTIEPSQESTLSRTASTSSRTSSRSSTSSMKKPQQKIIAKLPEKRKVYMTVSGMTCSSCVATIENRLNAVDGIFEAVVALMACRAEVSYDPLKISPEEVAELIDDMGFTTSAIQSAGDSKNQSELKLDIMGVTSTECWNEIETTVSKLAGVESIQILIDESKANIVHYPDLIGPRRIVDTINALGYTAFPSNADIVKNASDPMLEEIAKWRSSFFFSLIFGIPTVIAMFYFGHFWPASMENMTKDCCVVPGVNWENLILFVLATPVQFWGGRFFYVQVCLNPLILSKFFNSNLIFFRHIKH